MLVIIFGFFKREILTSPSFATYWADKLGAEKTSLAQLSGGINNRVFSCSSDQSKWVIKAYPNKDQKKRMKAEIDFLRYASIVAPEFTPKLLEIDQKYRCIVMEYIPGDLFLSKVRIPSLDHLQYSADFIAKLSKNMDLAKEMIELDAAEAFTTLSKHIFGIRERFSLVKTSHIPIQFKAKANKILSLLETRINQVDTVLHSQLSSGFIKD